VGNPKSTKPDGPNIPTAKGKRSASLQEIEETETSLWVGHQLNRIRGFLLEGGADCEMVAAVDYLIEDNDGWIDPQIAEDLRTGKLRPGEA
jgi:hypothetical protein